MTRLAGVPGSGVVSRVRAVARFYRARVRRVSSSELGRQLVASTGWSIVGDGVSRALMLLSLVILARMLGADGYGEFGFVRSTSALLATLGGLGLGLAANRFLAEFRSSDKLFSGEIVGSSYALAMTAGFIFGLGLFLFSPWIADSLLQQPSLRMGLRLASVLLAVNALNGAQIGILQGFSEFRSIAICNGVQGIVGALSIVVGGMAFGVNGAYGGLLLHGIAGIGVCHLAIARSMRAQSLEMSFAVSARMGSIIRDFSLPLVLMFVAVAPFRWYSETELVRVSGIGELGLFHAAMIVSNAIVVIASTLNAPLISAFASQGRASQSKRDQHINLYGSWYAFLVLGLPFVIFPGLALSAFGPEYQSKEFLSTAVLLVTYGGLLLYNQGVARLITIHGSMWFGLAANALEGIVLLVVALAVSSNGAGGLAAAYVVACGARIALSVPYLIVRRIAPASLFVDKRSMLTFCVFIVAAGVSLARAANL